MEEGYSPAMSEEAREAIKKICEDLLIKEAQACDEDRDPAHTYENYLNECGSYMTECMMEAAAGLNITEGKPATGQGNQYSVMDHALASWISHKLGPAAKNGTFSSNGTKVTFMNGGKTETYSKPVNIGAARMQNTGTWELNMDKVIFKVTVENLNVNESTAYKCDTCGERAEHEEIEENPKMRCSNCGDRSWIPEH
jgi:DNA-directed RNA polymerase subunit RPC12/RpoP